jgi:hypothetical protein
VLRQAFISKFDGCISAQQPACLKETAVLDLLDVIQCCLSQTAVQIGTLFPEFHAGRQSMLVERYLSEQKYATLLEFTLWAGPWPPLIRPWSNLKQKTLVQVGSIRQ